MVNRYFQKIKIMSRRLYHREDLDEINEYIVDRELSHERSKRAGLFMCFLWIGIAIGLEWLLREGGIHWTHEWKGITFPVIPVGGIIWGLLNWLAGQFHGPGRFL